MARPHPAALVTALLFVFALTANFQWVDWRASPASYAGGFFLLATPFLVLLAGHTFLARSLRRHLFFVLGNIPVAIGWVVACVLLLWFQLGWAGVFSFTVVLNALAVAILLLAKLIKEPQR